MSPSFNAWLVFPGGYYVLYENGDVYWVDLLMDTHRPANETESMLVALLWYFHRELFQTNNNNKI